ncbi:tetratricopeptide repeat protein, partial [Vibrio splendidus]
MTKRRHVASWRNCPLPITPRSAARAAYQNVLTREPANADAILGLTEVDIAAGDKAAARSQLAKLPATDNASLRRPRC